MSVLSLYYRFIVYLCDARFISASLANDISPLYYSWMVDMKESGYMGAGFSRLSQRHCVV